MPWPAWLAPSPADSRHRHQRLAMAASHGWLTGAKSTVAVLPVWRPRLRSRHLSRGYSTSQPLPKASCSMRARASRMNWRPAAGLDVAGPEPGPFLFGPVQQRDGSRGGEVPQDPAAPWQGAAAPGARPRGIAARTGSPAAAGGEGSARRSIRTRCRDRRARRRTLRRRGLPHAASSCGGSGRTARSASPTARSTGPGRCPAAVTAASSPVPAARCSCQGIRRGTIADGASGTGPARTGRSCSRGSRRRAAAGARTTPGWWTP